MSDEITPNPQSPEPTTKSGAKFLGFLDKYAPAEELSETILRAVAESKRRIAGADDLPSRAD